MAAGGADAVGGGGGDGGGGDGEGARGERGGGADDAGGFHTPSGRGAEFGEDANNTAKEGGVGKTSPDAAFFERETRESARRQRKARRPPTRDASFEANMEKL